ncbi:NAD(+) kinase [Echria macrotheca]|uniref:NAD(+) kinase n=1 Tax=Echria macrotheca TaxID=438768 RepID=A0AAJ0BAF8_9PEZI|nr:NAD(+) kinase [Echria macrotheca]
MTSMEDGQSSASDDDRNAVEVTFDDSNPYRRKSSLVRPDDVPRHLRKVDCMVHQFLESQKKPALGAGEKQHHHDHHHRHDQQHQHAHVEPATGGPEVISILPDPGMDRPQDPKGLGQPSIPEEAEDHESDADDDDEKSTRGRPQRPKCSLVTDPEATSTSDDDAGQTDEREWRDHMTSPVVEKPKPYDLDVAGGADKNGAAEHSRLLTKKQLGEMAWGVRELSRRLGSIRLRFRVRTIFLLVKIFDPDMVGKARELVAWLLDEAARATRYTVYVEEALRHNAGFDLDGLAAEVAAAQPDKNYEPRSVSKRVRVWDELMCRQRPHTFDFVITLGGDGTVLYASWLFQRIVPPVLSFALGSLGFLTKFDFGDYRRTLHGAFNEGVSVSLRLRFEATVMRSQPRHEDDERARDLVNELIGEEKDDERTHRPDGTYEVLNEVVVDRGPNPTMSETEIFGDDEHFTTVMADGVCVSTPTGSTAYNLAAGGSLCHPENPVMLLTAISPHTLSFRPIILPDTIILRLGVPFDARTGSWASFDGRERVELRPGDYVTVSASRYPFASVQLHNRRSEDWIGSISAKLAWNSRSRPKGFKEWDK